MPENMPKKKTTKPKISQKKSGGMKNLPKEAGVAAAHTLKGLGFSYANVAENLGISTTTVENYLKENVDPGWADFGEAIKDLILAREEEAATLALKQLIKLIPTITSEQSAMEIYERLRKMRVPQPVGNIPPQGIPAGGLHFHKHEKITKIVKEAEGEAEKVIRDEIKGGEK